MQHDEPNRSAHGPRRPRTGLRWVSACVACVAVAWLALGALRSIVDLGHRLVIWVAVGAIAVALVRMFRKH